MVEPGLEIATDQDARTDDDIGLDIDGGGAVPYVLDLDADIEQGIEVEQDSEIDVEGGNADDNLAVDVEVEQDVRVLQMGLIDIDVEEANGVVDVTMEVDLLQRIEIGDEIEIEIEGGGGSENHTVVVRADQDVSTVQEFDIEIDIEDAVLAQINVDVDQFAAIFQNMDIFLDFLSKGLAGGVDTVQEADLKTSVEIAFDILGIKPT
jgi:hypothetical protein